MPPTSRGIGQLLVLGRRAAYDHAVVTSLQKKGARSNKKSKGAADSDSGNSNSNSNDSAAAAAPAAVDPFDHSALQAAIERAISRLKDNLTRSRDAGRVSAPMIEALSVELSSGRGGGSKEKARIGDIASVVPKGARSMQVFCADEGHVKAVMGALQASDYSLTPQLEKNNNSNDNVTAETRLQAQAEAKKAAEKAGLEVGNARAEAQKRFRKMELEKRVAVDELRKAHKGMEDVAKQGQAQVKTVLDAALKALAR
ncbi:hypothetical protein DV735_g5712, partial [Chaetothyriales sp. CBS 134920]